MNAFELNQVVAKMPSSQASWSEFLRVPALSMGVYRLAAQAQDPQQPHSEDEVYYIVGGRGWIRVAGEKQRVQAGSIVYVPAHVEHHFFAVEEELTILVFFAPAEHSCNER